MVWEEKLQKVDEDLKISDSLVVESIHKLKNSSVPDSMRPDVIKLLLGRRTLFGRF